MNLPQEHVDQMLSGYLDDALSVDERAEVERWLQDDAAIAAQYDELQSIRRSLRSIAGNATNATLPAGFSERVMEAAVARARAEGFADDHPLIQVSEQPTSLAEPVPAPPWRKIASIMAAVAASIALAMFAVRQENTVLLDQSQEKDRTAVVPPDATRFAEDRSFDSNRSVAPQSDPAPLDRIAEADAGTDSATMDFAVGKPASPDIMSAKPADKNAAKSVNTPESTDTAVMTAQSPSSIPADDVFASASTNELKAVLVIDVELTETGRAIGAVRSAMRSSSILPSDQQGVSDDNVRATLVASGQEADKPVSIFYLQAPAKRLDQFYLRLLADEAGVASVAMTVASNLPIPDVIERADVKPTEVRHDGLLQVADPELGLQQLGPRLGQLSYVPFDSAMVNAVTPDSGVDFPTQVLVRVR